MPKSALYIITGSSKGIGKTLVDKLLEKDENQVIGIARSPYEMAHPRFLNLSLDLSNVKETLKSLDRMMPQGDFDKIVLVNNAGMIGPIEHLGNMDPKSIHQVFMLNTIAPAILMNDFVHKYGSLKEVDRLIINISSGAAKKAIDGWACYSASKSAINMLSEAAVVEAELDATGIRIFSVAPGVVDTYMQAEIRNADVKAFSTLSKFVGLKENQQLSSPLHTASKIIELIDNPSRFKGIHQDVREF
jgi:benzil reductase ((S)-benzoin forming)